MEYNIYNIFHAFYFHMILQIVQIDCKAGNINKKYCIHHFLAIVKHKGVNTVVYHFVNMKFIKNVNSVVT